MELRRDRGREGAQQLDILLRLRRHQETAARDPHRKGIGPQALRRLPHEANVQDLLRREEVVHRDGDLQLLEEAQLDRGLIPGGLAQAHVPDGLAFGLLCGPLETGERVPIQELERVRLVVPERQPR